MICKYHSEHHVKSHMKEPEAKNKVSFQVAPPHLLLNKKFHPLSHLSLCHLMAETNCLRQLLSVWFFYADFLFHPENQRISLFFDSQNTIQGRKLMDLFKKIDDWAIFVSSLSSFLQIKWSNMHFFSLLQLQVT